MSGLSGVITALVTPFNREGEVDLAALRRLIDFQVKGGVDGLFLCGTAGSGVIMRPDQRELVFREAADYAGGRVRLLAHVGAASTEESVMLAEAAFRTEVDAVGAVPPYFLSPDAESIIGHFKAIAGAAQLPTYVYNIPKSAVNAVTPEMMLKLAEVPNIVGVKDSSRDFINLLEYLRVLPENFTVICGTDSYIYPAAVMGCKGCITGYANAFPDEYARFWKAISEGRHKEARRLQFSVNVLRAALQKPPNAPHYEALRLRGVDAGIPRPPLRGMRPEEKEALRKRLTELGVLG
ncbi:MAG TPA: dihydrodipicolinate synthase family protein [Candidatus Desulfaltia sp.]|nr:dihydrodipicolinate synthase family protein [Candidatus Desulfaltia sp.]